MIVENPFVSLGNYQAGRGNSAQEEGKEKLDREEGLALVEVLHTTSILATLRWPQRPWDICALGLL